MRNIFFVLGCTAVLAQAASPIPQASPIEITIHLYNAAGVERGTIFNAEHTADWIFRKAGVVIRWVQCPLPDPANGGEQVCGETSDPLLFAVWIANQAAPETASDNALGFALPFAGQSNHAGVIYSKLVETQRQHAGMLDCGPLLAYVIAHELAHLVLRSGHHGTGMMHAGWADADFRRMGQRDFGFDGEQARWLREGLESRLSGSSDLLAFATSEVAPPPAQPIPTTKK